MSHEDVTISILTYNQVKLAKRCLGSVLVSRGGAKLLLTSNGNEEAYQLFSELEEKHSDIIALRNENNEGFIAPNNLAFDLCKTKYFVLLNDDAVPPFDWLEKMKEKFVDPKVAVVGVMGGGCTLTNQFIGYRGPVLDYVEGSCMMVDVEKVRTIQAHGLFAAYLSFAYCEDADLCLRVRNRGFKIARADFKLVEHARSATTKTIPGIGVHMRKNFKTCARLWSPYFLTRKFSSE
jgi:GT2 family glycosyltransferase